MHKRGRSQTINAALEMVGKQIDFSRFAKLFDPFDLIARREAHDSARMIAGDSPKSMFVVPQ